MTLQTNLEATLSCSVCLELMKNPKVLPCQHHICDHCCSKLETKREIKCPQCRHTSSFSKVKRSLVLEQIVEIYEESLLQTDGDQQGICEVCKEQEVSWICCSCCRLLCKSCNTCHLQLSPCTTNNTIPINIKKADDKKFADQVLTTAKFAKQKLETLQVEKEDISQKLKTEREVVQKAIRLARNELKRKINEHFDEIDAKVAKFYRDKVCKLEGSIQAQLLSTQDKLEKIKVLGEKSNYSQSLINQFNYDLCKELVLPPVQQTVIYNCGRNDEAFKPQLTLNVTFAKRQKTV